MDLTQHIDKTAPWLRERAASVDLDAPATFGFGLGDMLEDKRMVDEVNRVATIAQQKLEALKASDPAEYTRRQAELEEIRGGMLYSTVREKIKTAGKGWISDIALDRMAIDLSRAMSETGKGTFSNLSEAWSASGSDTVEDPSKNRFQHAIEAAQRIWNNTEGFTAVLMAGLAFIAELVAPGLSRNASQITAADVATRTMEGLEKDGMQGRYLLKMGEMIEKVSLEQMGIKDGSSAIHDFAVKSRKDATPALEAPQRVTPTQEGVAGAGALLSSALGFGYKNPPAPDAIPSVKTSLSDLPDPKNLGRSLLAASIVGATVPYTDEAVRRQLRGDKLDSEDRLDSRVAAQLLLKGKNPVYDKLAADIRRQSGSDAEAAAYLNDIRPLIAKEATAAQESTGLVLPYLPNGKMLPPIVFSRVEMADASKWTAAHDLSLKSMVDNVSFAARQMTGNEVAWDRRFGGIYQWADLNGVSAGRELRPQPSTIIGYSADMRTRLASGGMPQEYDPAALVGQNVQAMRGQLSHLEASDLLAKITQYNQTANSKIALPKELQDRLAQEGSPDKVSAVRIDEVRPFLKTLGNPSLDTPKAFDDARQRYTLAELKARRDALVNSVSDASTPDLALPAVTGGASSFFSECTLVDDAIASAQNGRHSDEETLTTIAIDRPDRVARIVAAANQALDRLDKRYMAPAASPAVAPAATPAPAPAPALTPAPAAPPAPAPQAESPAIASNSAGHVDFGWLRIFNPFPPAVAAENVDPGASLQSPVTPRSDKEIAVGQ